MKSLLFSTFFLFAIISTAQETKTDKAFESDIEVTRSAQDTWQYLSDVALWKKWDSHIIDARLIGDLSADAKGTLVTSDSKVVNFKIVDFKQGESYTIRHKLSSGILYMKRTIAPNEVGSKISTKIWYTGLSTKNFKKYMGNDYDLVLEKDLKRFQKLLLN